MRGGGHGFGIALHRQGGGGSQSIRNARWGRSIAACAITRSVLRCILHHDVCLYRSIVPRAVQAAVWLPLVRAWDVQHTSQLAQCTQLLGTQA